MIQTNQIETLARYNLDSEQENIVFDILQKHQFDDFYRIAFVNIR